MNRACLLDYSLASFAEAEGKTDFDLSPAHIATQFRFDDERVLMGAKIVNRVELVRRFDHIAVWFVTDKAPFRYERGRIVGTAGVARPLAKDAVFPVTADAAGLTRAAAVSPPLACEARMSSPRLSERTLADIAAAHDFCDLSHFGRQFRCETGLTPRECRLRYRTHSGD